MNTFWQVSANIAVFMIYAFGIFSVSGSDSHTFHNPDASNSGHLSSSHTALKANTASSTHPMSSLNQPSPVLTESASQPAAYLSLTNYSLLITDAVNKFINANSIEEYIESYDQIKTSRKVQYNGLVSAMKKIICEDAEACSIHLKMCKVLECFLNINEMRIGRPKTSEVELDKMAEECWNLENELEHLFIQLGKYSRINVKWSVMDGVNRAANDDILGIVGEIYGLEYAEKNCVVRLERHVLIERMLLELDEYITTIFTWITGVEA